MNIHNLHHRQGERGGGSPCSVMAQCLYQKIFSESGQICRTLKLYKMRAKWETRNADGFTTYFRMTAKQLDQLRRYAEEKRITP
jgi:hypothetical protein